MENGLTTDDRRNDDPVAANGFDELEQYLNSANLYIGMAEDDLRFDRADTKGKSQENKRPPEIPYVTPQRFSRTSYGYSSLNSAARKKRERTDWKSTRHSANPLASLDALLDSLKCEDERSKPETSMDISDIEKMTKQLVIDLESLGCNERNPSKIDREQKDGETETLIETPINKRILELSEIATPSLESPVDVSVASPNWKYMGKRSISMDNILDDSFDTLNDSIASRLTEQSDTSSEFPRAQDTPKSTDLGADCSHRKEGQVSRESFERSTPKIAQNRAGTSRDLRRKFFNDLLELDEKTRPSVVSSEGEKRLDFNQRQSKELTPAMSPSSEAFNHPIIISYKSALEKSSEALKSNPDLSEIISRSMGQQPGRILKNSDGKRTTPNGKDGPAVRMGKDDRAEELRFFDSTLGLDLIEEFEEQFKRLIEKRRDHLVDNVQPAVARMDRLSTVKEEESPRSRNHSRGSPDRYATIPDVNGNEAHPKFDRKDDMSWVTSPRKSMTLPRQAQTNRYMTSSFDETKENPRFAQSPSIDRDESCSSLRSVRSDGVRMRRHNRLEPQNDVRGEQEAEAVQAIAWLRHTGFPQYVQMYEDNAFPLDMESVFKDHPLLDPDEIQALSRRLTILNKCAKMRSDAFPELHTSDEDLAISENWKYHRPSRRWSRIETPCKLDDLSPSNRTQDDELSGSCASSTAKSHNLSHESISGEAEDGCAVQEATSDPDDPPVFSPSKVISLGEAAEMSKLRNRRNHNLPRELNQRRGGSERMKDAIIRKVDSLRRRRSRSPKAPKSKISVVPDLPTGRKNSSIKSEQSDDGRGYDNHGLTEDLVDVYGNAFREHDPAIDDHAQRDPGTGTRSDLSSKDQTVPVWHCFQQDIYEQSFLDAEAPVSLSTLSAANMMILQKHALLRLTALMEKYSPPYKSGWAWSVSKIFRKITAPNYKDKIIFGVPLSFNVQKTGHPLPPSLQAALDFLSNEAPRCSGMFRKSGVRSRIEKLRQIHEAQIQDAHLLNYEEQQCHDVADMIKQFFRELPEGGLLTAKLAQTFLYIFMHLPSEHQCEALQSAIILLPDENREVLFTLLCFLRGVSEHSESNGMTASNLALCFAPSIFQLTQTQSPKRKRKDSWTGEREIWENRAAKDCLCKMIEWQNLLFSIATQTVQHSRLVKEKVCKIADCLKRNLRISPERSLEFEAQWLFQEMRLNRGWTQFSHPDIDLAYKRIDDEYHYIRLWRCSTLVEAPPVEVLTRLIRERHLWDDSLAEHRVIRRIDSKSDVCMFVEAETDPQPNREYLILREWRTDRGNCFLSEVSVDDDEWKSFSSDSERTIGSEGNVRALVLASRYLIQPGGTGKSKVTHLVRLDSRGRSGGWYTRSSGNIHALKLMKLTQSFKTSEDSRAGSSRSGTPSNKETKI